MAVAVGTAVEFFTAGEVILTVGEAAFVAQAAAVIGMAAYNSSRARAAARAARAAFNASLQDHQVMVRSGVAPRNIVYGRDKVSGPVVFAMSTGTLGEYLHLVVVLSAHESDAVETIYFNDVALPALDVNGFVQSGQYAKTATHGATESVTSASSITLSHTPTAISSVTHSTSVDSATTLALGTDYTVAGAVITFLGGVSDYTVNYEYQQVDALVRIKIHLGAAGQTADADLVSECSSKWTTNHVGASVTYLYVRLKYDQDVFGQVGIPNISAKLRGKKVLDTRTSTTAWTANSALCAADYMRDAVLGLGCTAGEVPSAELNAAANTADEAVVIDGIGTTQTRYTTNGNLSTADGRRANLEALLAPMAGNAVNVQGRWLLRAGAARSYEFTLDESWLATGTNQHVPRRPRSELFNAVTGTFINPAEGYAETQIPPVESATYKAQDGGKRIPRSLQMPFVNESLRAQRLCKIALERSRLALTMKFTCNMKAYDTLPTQVGRVNLSRYGYSNQLVEVRERAFNPVDRTVTLTLVKTASTVWDWIYSDAITSSVAAATTLPNPFARPAQLAGLAVVSGSAQLLSLADGSKITRGLVTWTQSTDVFVVRGGSIEVQWKLDNAADWQDAPPINGEATSAYVAPLDLRRVTLVRARAVNALGRSGPWAYAQHAAIGKTTLPLNVSSFAVAQIPTGLRFTWTRNTDLDLAATEIHEEATWNDATAPLWKGDANFFEISFPTAGSHTYLAKHVDTTKNRSLTAASVTITVDANGLVSTSELQANAATVPQTLAVNSDAYTFPSSTGVQARTYTALTWANSTGATVSVEVSVTASRKIQTPAGLSGTTPCRAGVSIENVTDSLLVGSTPDWLPAQILAQGAGVTATFQEASVFSVDVPNGKTFSFTSYCTVQPNVGSTGNIVLTTEGLAMRLAAIKR